MKDGKDQNHGRRPNDSGDATDRLEAERGEELFSLVYVELRHIAHRIFARERPGHTLQPTALVNEAYLKLAEQKQVRWKSRTHFLAVSAQAMRRLLVDHARKRGAAKRGSNQKNLDLMDVLDSAADHELNLDQILSVNSALEQLAEFDQRQALIVTLRFFGGLTVEETADVTGVSMGTVARDWRHARAWLQLEISRE